MSTIQYLFISPSYLTGVSNSRLTGINQLCVRYTVTGGLLFFSWAKHLPSLLRTGWLSNIISETDKQSINTHLKKRFMQLKLKGWVLTCIKTNIYANKFSCMGT